VVRAVVRSHVLAFASVPDRPRDASIDESFEGAIVDVYVAC